MALDFERLSLPQVALISKLVELIGVHGDEESLRWAIDVAEAVLSMYRRQLMMVVETNKRHGG